jgi:hypothetical protein
LRRMQALATKECLVLYRPCVVDSVGFAAEVRPL